MRFYFERLNFSSQDLFLLLTIGLIILAIILNIPLPYISRGNLLFLAIVVLLGRALLPSKYLSALFFVIILILVLIVFLPQLWLFPILRLVLLVLLALLLLRLLAGI